MTTTEPTTLTLPAWVNLDKLVPEEDRAIINDVQLQALRVWETVRPMIPLVYPYREIQNRVTEAGGPDFSEHLVEPIREAVGVNSADKVLDLIAAVVDAARCEGRNDALHDALVDALNDPVLSGAWVTDADLEAEAAR